MRIGREVGNTLTEIYMTNMTDEDGYLSRYTDFNAIRKTQNKPRVVGVRFRYRY